MMGLGLPLAGLRGAARRGNPGWLVPGAPSLQFDFADRRAWMNGRAYYDEAAIKSLFSTFSTPAHLATGKDGVVYSVAANRMDSFVVAAGQCHGQLVEEARTNTLTYSKQFDNAAWVKGGATIAPAATAGPDGTLSAALLLESSSSGEHLAYQANTATGSNVVSIYAKYAGRFLAARVDPSAAAFAVFDLQNGIVTSVKSGSTASIEALANGWYRCTLATSATGNVVWKLSSTGTVSNAASGGQADYTGNGAGGVYLWQADRQAGTFNTSPIVTTSAAVTRAASSITRNLAGEFNPAAGTLFTDYRAPGNSALAIAAGLYASSVNTLNLNSTAANIPGFNVLNGNVSQAAISLGAEAPAGQVVKTAGAYAVNDFRAARDGVLGTPDLSGSLPGVTVLILGHRPSGAHLNSCLRRTAYFPRAASNAELQGMTL